MIKKNRINAGWASLLQKFILICIGIFCVFVILETSLRMGSFAVLFLQEQKNLQSLKKKGTYRIMCIGESTTIGEYPRFLENILSQNCTKIKFSVIDKGIVATTTSAIISQLPHNLAIYKPDMVIAMMGINDRTSYMAYKQNTDSRQFLGSLKTYNLVRFIWLALTNKKKNDISKASTPIPPAPVSISDLSFTKDKINTSQGIAFWECGEYQKAQEVFLKLIQSNPEDSNSYVYLATIYWALGNISLTKETFKKAIQINPGNSYTYFQLGKFYRSQLKFEDAENVFKKALELEENLVLGYIELATLYIRQNRYNDAKALLEKGIALSFNDDPQYIRLYGALIRVYEAEGDYISAGIIEQKLKEWNMKFYSPETASNFLVLKKILDAQKIILVVVQYPIRSIEPLKRIFKDEQNIIFVDNEKIFKEAIKKKGYNIFFQDTFGGEFGHCTSAGNQLLAEDIANTILKKVFKQ